MSETVPAIAIGAILGDSDLVSMSWSRAIGTLSHQVESLTLGLESEVRVNVVFHVDGKLVPNKFVGVRTGYFNSAKSMLVVQAAVPSEPRDDMRSVLLRLLEIAINEAEAFARRKSIANDLDQIRSRIESLAAR